MVTEVNAQLPEQARFAPFGWYTDKSNRLLREYARLYPTGPRIRQLQWRVTGVFIGMAAVVLAVVPNRFGVMGALWFTVMGYFLTWVQVREVVRNP